MMIDKLIAAAEARLDDSVKNGSSWEVDYWRGYRDALVRVKEEKD